MDENEAMNKKITKRGQKFDYLISKKKNLNNQFSFSFCSITLNLKLESNISKKL